MLGPQLQRASATNDTEATFITDPSLLKAGADRAAATPPYTAREGPTTESAAFRRLTERRHRGAPSPTTLRPGSPARRSRSARPGCLPRSPAPLRSAESD